MLDTIFFFMVIITFMWLTSKIQKMKVDHQKELKQIRRECLEGLVLRAREVPEGIEFSATDKEIDLTIYCTVKLNKRQSNSSNNQSSIWHVLGIMPTNDRDKIEKAFRKMSMVYHPDHGGTSTAFNTLVKAKEKAISQLRN